MLILLALILGLTIIATETIRPKTGGVVDFLRAFSVVYFVAFVLTPAYMFAEAQLGLSQLIIKTGFVATIAEPEFSYALIVALFSYCIIVFSFIASKGFASYMLSPRIFSSFRNFELPPDRPDMTNILVALGMFTGCIGVIAFCIYAINIGGIENLIKYGGAMRSNLQITSKYAFLKNLSPFIIASSFYFYAAVKSKNVSCVFAKKLLFIMAYFTSLLLLYHMAGRLNIVSYILIFPLASMLLKKKCNLKIFIFGGFFFLAMIIFGKEIFHILIDPKSVSRKMMSLETDFSIIFHYLFLEFSFPLVNLANAIGYLVPDLVQYRYFSDIWLAVLELVPQKLLNVEFPDTVSMINTKYFGSDGTIPVDLLTFGYYSAGLIGVFLIVFMFGLFLRIFDLIFPYSRDPSNVVFRVAWMLFLSFRIMYGDPSISIKGGFYLIASTLLFLVCRNYYLNSSQHKPLIRQVNI